MGRISAVILLVAAMVAISSCSDAEPSVPEPSSQPSSSEITISKSGAAIVAKLPGRLKSLWTYEPGFVSSTGIGEPDIAIVNGQRLVFTAHWAVERASGTTSDRYLLRVVALDMATGDGVWAKDVYVDGLPTSYHDLGESLPDVKIQPVRSDGQYIAATFSFSGHGSDTGDLTHVLDAVTGEVHWKRNLFRAVGFSSHVLVGVGTPTSAFDYPATEALASADGSTRWTVPQSRPDLLGDGLVAVDGSRNREDSIVPERFTLIVSAQSGKTLATLERSGYSCYYDGLQTVVCGRYSIDGDRRHLVAFDRQSFNRLWELSGESPRRLVPRLEGAWQGEVCGMVERDNGEIYVILDARTGKDKTSGSESLMDRCSQRSARTTSVS